MHLHTQRARAHTHTHTHTHEQLVSATRAVRGADERGFPGKEAQIGKGVGHLRVLPPCVYNSISEMHGGWGIPVCARLFKERGGYRPSAARPPAGPARLSCRGLAGRRSGRLQERRPVQEQHTYSVHARGKARGQLTASAYIFYEVGGFLLIFRESNNFPTENKLASRPAKKQAEGGSGQREPTSRVAD